jgi:hypothetical protein
MFYEIAIPILYSRVKTNDLAGLLEGTANFTHEGPVEPLKPDSKIISKKDQLAYITHLHLCPWQDEEPLAAKVLRDGCWEEIGETREERQERMEEEYSWQNQRIMAALNYLDFPGNTAKRPFPKVKTIILGQAADSGYRKMELGVDPEKDPFASLWLHPIKDRVLELVMNTKAPHICVYSFFGPFALGGGYPAQLGPGKTIVTLHIHGSPIPPMPQMGAINRVNFQPGVCFGYESEVVFPTLRNTPQIMLQSAREHGSMVPLKSTTIKWYGAFHPSDLTDQSARMAGQSSDDIERQRLAENKIAIHEAIPEKWRQRIQLGLKRDAPLCPACGMY